MGSKDKFYSIQSADKGTDDIGFSQASGAISAIADAKTAHGRWAGKLMLTTTSTAALQKGQPINITNLDAGHNGLTRVLAIVSATRFIVNIPFNVSLVDGTGNWDVRGGAGAWDAFMPMVDIPPANLPTITFWDQQKQGGEENKTTYKAGVLYPFPGVIKTILLATAGDIRLVRSATLRPQGRDAQ